ncbi:MAG: hypothetical protein WC693_02900 [Patescibacteria group bacterium]
MIELPKRKFIHEKPLTTEQKGIAMLMPQWVSELETESTAEDRQPIEAEFKVGGDEELGDVPDELQLLFCLRRVLSRKISACQMEYRHVCGRQDGWSCQCYQAQVLLLTKQRNLLNQLFWLSLRMHFGIHEGFVGLRSDWKAVRCPEMDPEESDITPADCMAV